MDRGHRRGPARGRHPLGQHAIVNGYRRALEEDTRRLSLASSHAVALDVQVGRRSRLAGRPLAEAGLPRGCLVVTVRNDDGLQFADGATVLREGDTLSVLGRPDSAEEVRRLIEDGHDGQRRKGRANHEKPAQGGLTTRGPTDEGAKDREAGDR